MKRRGWRVLWALALLAGCGDSGEGGGGAGGSPGRKGSDLFREDEVNDFHLTMAPADWQSIIDDTMGDIYRRASLRWKGVEVTDIAVRPSGHATRWPGNAKQSIKLKFNEFVPGQRFQGLKTLKLDGLVEGSMMRERICYGVFRALLPLAPRAVHCRLHVNGEYRGVYLVEERVTDDLVEHRTGFDDAYLYRIMVEFPEAFADRGPDPAAYLPRPFQPETHELDGDHAPLVNLIRVLHQAPAELAAVCDVEDLTSYLALEVALISRDGLLRDDGPPQNAYVLLRPGTNRFEFIPWDLDQTLTHDRALFDLYHNFHQTRIASVVRETPALDARFRQKVLELTNTLLHPDVIGPRIDAIYGQIRVDVYADPNKRITNEAFDQVPGYLKSVIRTRADHLRAQLGAP